VECLALLAAAAPWLYPGVPARIAAGRSSLQGFESPIDAADLQAVALAVLGAAYAMDGLAALAVHGLHYVRMAHLGDAFASAAERGLFSTVADAAQAALGVGLALGARGLNGVLLRVRSRGPAVAGAGEEP